MNSKWAIFHWNVHPPCWALGEISLWYVRWHHGRVKNKEYWWGHINPGIPRLAKSLVHPGPGLHVCQKSLFSDIFPWVVPWLQADRARGTYSVDMWRVTEYWFYYLIYTKLHFLFERASSRLKYSQYLYIPISQNRYQKENIKQSICREYFPLPGCWFVPKCCSHLPLPLSSLDDLWEIHVGIKLICFTNFGFILLPSLSERG